MDLLSSPLLFPEELPNHQAQGLAVVQLSPVNDVIPQPELELPFFPFPSISSHFHQGTELTKVTGAK